MTSSTKGETAAAKARAIAERLFPGADPVEWAKRKVISELLDAGADLDRSRRILRRVLKGVWVDLERAWIQPLPTEGQILDVLTATRKCTRALEEAEDLIAGLRTENQLRKLSERSRERAERRAVHG